MSQYSLVTKRLRSTYRRHSAQLKLCLPLFSLSPLPALPPALPDSAADVLLIGTAGGCIDPEASELEVNPPSGGASDDTICKVKAGTYRNLALMAIGMLWEFMFNVE